MNCAMQIEREQTLRAESHQRTADRQGYANGLKPKPLRTQAGEVHLRIPHTRDYHDDEGRPFYPKSLDRGIRSQRAMTSTVAEMYVKGVSTRKVTKIVEQLCGLQVTSTQVSRAAAEDVRRIFSADDAAEADRRLKAAVARYHKTAPDFANWLEANIPEALTVFAFPAAHRRRLRTSNGLERLNEEIKRCTRVAPLFPNEALLRIE